MCVSNRIRRIAVGAGRIFDFSGCYGSILKEKYLNSDSSEIDRSSLGSDWIKVGMDIRKSAQRVGEYGRQKR